MITPPAIPGQEIPVVPFPPSTGAMDSTWQLAFNVNLWIVSAVFIFFALRTWRRTGSPLPLMLLAGGGLCVFLEPIVDVMGLCWWIALNSTDTAWVTNLCALATCGLAAVLIWVATLAAGTDSVVARSLALGRTSGAGRPAGAMT